MTNLFIIIEKIVDSFDFFGDSYTISAAAFVELDHITTGQSIICSRLINVEFCYAVPVASYVCI